MIKPDVMKCPHCKKKITKRLIAAALRAIPSKARAEASRLNGAKGGRPRKKPSVDAGKDVVSA